MQLTYDNESNTLRLFLPIPAEPSEPEYTVSLDGILDIGEGGRLIGVEFPADDSDLHLWLIDDVAADYTSLDATGRAYVQITPDDAGEFRSANLRLTAEYNAHGELIGIVIPRRGDGYEISYPSGNQ